MKRKIDPTASINFSQVIERYIKDNSLTLLEGLTQYCSIYDIDYEMVKNLLSPKLKEELRNEAVSLNLLKNKTARLPNEYI